MPEQQSKAHSGEKGPGSLVRVFPEGRQLPRAFLLTVFGVQGESLSVGRWWSPSYSQELYDKPAFGLLKGAGMVVRSFNLSAWETETAGSL